MKIDDERDLHGQLETAFDVITPRAAPVDGAVRRGRAVRVRRRAAVAAGAAAAVAIGIFAVPSLLPHSAAPGLATQAGRYTVTVQAPGPHPAPGLIASGSIDGQRWQLTAAKPGTGGAGPGGQIFTTSGPAFGGHAGSQPAAALAVDSANPVSFSGSVLTGGRVQVQYGAVRADVTFVAVRLGNSTVLILHPVTVYGVRAVAFAVPVGAGSPVPPRTRGTARSPPRSPSTPRTGWPPSASGSRPGSTGWPGLRAGSAPARSTRARGRSPLISARGASASRPPRPGSRRHSACPPSLAWT